MTSQLNVDIIVDKAGSGGSNVKMANTSTYVSDGGSATQNTVQGLSKAWFHVALDGASISDSFNISSHDDDGSGDGGIHISNDMGSANYSVQLSSDDGATSSAIVTIEVTKDAQAAGNFDYETAFVNSSTNRTNSDITRFGAIFGDLA